MKSEQMEQQNHRLSRSSPQLASSPSQILPGDEATPQSTKCITLMHKMKLKTSENFLTTAWWLFRTQPLSCYDARQAEERRRASLTTPCAYAQQGYAFGHVGWCLYVTQNQPV